jgi:hypothetical protein
MDSRTQEGATGRRYWIGGSKGGVGKSMLPRRPSTTCSRKAARCCSSSATTEALDVFRAYQDLVPTVRADLDESQGWIHLVNVCDAHRDRAVVLNTAAR